jgi:hypothetical protein
VLNKTATKGASVELHRYGGDFIALAPLRNGLLGPILTIGVVSCWSLSSNNNHRQPISVVSAMRLIMFAGQNKSVFFAF